MAYTEFYCQNGGSNLNAGSTTNNTAAYTSNAGNWNQSTRVFTPTDGSNPSSSVAVGDWGSVYVTAGATVAVWVARVSAVQNAANGTITFANIFAGANPANGTGTMTIKIGGAWQGPNAATGFPFTLASFGNNKDATAHIVRVNMKNDQTYSLTAAFTPNSSGSMYVAQGYTSSVGDGGRATFDGGTSAGTILLATGPGGTNWADLVFKTSITTGTTDIVTTGSVAVSFVRCVFSGSRGNGLNFSGTSGGYVIECEAYGNNTSNSVSKGGFAGIGLMTFQRCYSHDNTGSNTAGFLISGQGTTLEDCIADTNGGIGISITPASAGPAIAILNCDLYNNGSDGININSAATFPMFIENCNFLKNTGAGINNVSVINSGYIYNCGYGAGTQANGSADTINNLTKTGTVTYASNVTPWTDPANGDFRISLAAAINAGRGSFTQTSPTAGAVGYPDIGAVQATATGGGGARSTVFGG